MRKRPWNLRAAAGLQLGRECSVYFWAGWAAWAAAMLSCIYSEYILRTAQELSFYLVEAWLGFLSPFIALWLADWLAGDTYQTIWSDISRKEVSNKFVDSGIVDAIRSEFKGNLLLKPMTPPQSRDSRSQLYTVSLWYPAVTKPPGASWWSRFGEYCIDLALGYVPFLAAIVIFMVGAGTATVPLTALMASVGLATLGYSSIRFASRRQAILDFFDLWKSEQEV